MNVALFNDDHSLLSLTASILRHYGAKTPHKTLPEIDALLRHPYKNVIIMQFDGLGTVSLEKHLPPDAFLRRHHIGDISSVFPPTTTAATTTTETGLSPIEHGWLGWSLYFKEVDANVSIFPNTLSGSDGVPAAPYNLAQTHLPYTDIYDKIRDSTGGGVRAVSLSPFSKDEAYRCRTLEEIPAQINTLSRMSGRSYIYVYWHQPDYDMHDYGTGHERVREHIETLDHMVETLAQTLDDTLILVTADHGLIDVTFSYITDYPDLAECLLRPPSIETRTLSLFIKPGLHNCFRERFLRHFGDSYTLFTKEQVFSINLFGSGTSHPRAPGFIGDFIAVATGTRCIGYAPPEPRRDEFRAAHAGMTRDEFRIPLIVVEKR